MRYWNEVGEAIGGLFRRVRPHNDDQMIGTVERLLPEPLDERALLNKLSSEVEYGQSKAILSAKLMPSAKM